MHARKRSITSILVTCGVLALAALAAFAVVHARQAGGGALQPMATVSPGSAPPPIVSAAAGESLIAKVTGAVTVYREPRRSAAVRAHMPRLNAHGYPTLMLVRSWRVVDGETWYAVSLAARPAGGTGWVPADAGVSTYITQAKIVVHVAARRLDVYRSNKLMGTFAVAVGSPQYPTPTGHFFINEKFEPPAGGPYGVLAMGLNAFQPKLATLGAIAIHGTNNDSCIGRAVTDGCIRLHNADVLKVNAWVPSGSPVVIVR